MKKKTTTLNICIIIVPASIYQRRNQLKFSSCLVIFHLKLQREAAGRTGGRSSCFRALVGFHYRCRTIFIFFLYYTFRHNVCKVHIIGVFTRVTLLDQPSPLPFPLSALRSNGRGQSGEKRQTL